jgi:epoxyqueuosine reductase
MTRGAKTALVKEQALKIGFDSVGITTAGPVVRARYYREWLDRGYGGTMGYLGRNVRLRGSPADLLPGAQSVICVALAYGRDDRYARTADAGASAAGGADAAPCGRVAQYARGADYHVVLRRMLEALGDALRERLREPFEVRPCVDTAPVLERALAERAGLGWIGRNTCLLSAARGSFLLLGELITTLDLEPDQPATPKCGQCRRCVDACPTGALVAPGQLDARKCISYLTIEHRGAIDPALEPQMGGWVFGCDLCQQVCPYNRRAPAGRLPEIMADRLPRWLDLRRLLWLRSGEYRRLTAGSAARRARRGMWRRNAAIALGNLPRPTPDAIADLEAAAADDDPVVADAARRSLERVRMRKR